MESLRGKVGFQADTVRRRSESRDPNRVRPQEMRISEQVVGQHLRRSVNVKEEWELQMINVL